MYKQKQPMKKANLQYIKLTDQQGFQNMDLYTQDSGYSTAPNATGANSWKAWNTPFEYHS